MTRILTIPIKSLDAKQKPLTSIIIEHLKRREVRGDVARQWCQMYPQDYLLRKIWYAEYQAEMHPIVYPAYIRHALEMNYGDSEEFWTWYKTKKHLILNSDSEDLKRMLI